MTKLEKTLLALTAFFMTLTAAAADRFVSFTGGDHCLNDNKVIDVHVDANDCKGVMRAAKTLVNDIEMATTDTKAKLTESPKAKIVIGTLGYSEAINALAKVNIIDEKQLKGKNEKYIITTTNDGSLVIAGSDRRGTIYGIYELSRQLGVSPWNWWADVPTERHSNIYVNKGTYTDGEPAVRYRGIFLNDEAPCLTTWVKNTYGTDFGDHRFYERVFELILRLRGNMLWPAMWGWAFYADDPLNGKTADEMGVIVGTSHHEPMARNHQEYARQREQWGPWNYNTNKENIQRFFREGMERAKGTEDLITIGMRGDGDEAMSEEADTRLLEQVVADQRKIIAKVTGKKASETPQVWALYKEVLDYYDKGMRVPDDIIMLLCDDNWGNVRRVPTEKELKHKGGWGLYYHVDYVGAPRNSKFLNATPTQNMWEQLTLAYDYGIDRLWILNVGDLKPMEYPIQMFLDMAWNPREFDAGHITDHTLRFCRQQFGCCQAEEAARILNLCCKYNGRCTAEMLNADTYDIDNGDWQTVISQYKQLELDALRQYASLPDNMRDAYRQIILFPVQAMSNLHQMYYAQAMNLRAHEKGCPSQNHWADECEKAFKRDSMLCAEYNLTMSNGKWNGMMIQKHIGYTSWNDNFPKDTCPKLHRTETSCTSAATPLSPSAPVPCASAHGLPSIISLQAPDYTSCIDSKEAKWTLIPFMGKGKGAMTLMPYKASVAGASISYKFKGKAGKARLHVVTKSTLDFLNKGGLTYSVSVDGGTPVTVNFNAELNEKPENIYSIYYPTIASRVIDKTVELEIEATADDMHTVTLCPNDPAIVFEKIVVDYRPNGGRVSHL
ncbi:MAG: glycosyl hydrolase 115 family protein [Prevotella sp.]